jgi:hypothetical protein
MISSDLRKIINLHSAFWKKESKRPLFCYLNEYDENISKMKLAIGTTIVEGMLLSPEMISAENLHPQFTCDKNKDLDKTLKTEGDIFKTISPYWKIPWTEAIIGCPIHVSISSNSIWAEAPSTSELPNISSADDIINYKWLKKLIEVTKYLVKNFYDSYFVTQLSVTRGPIDMLDALIGTKRMVVAMHTQSQLISRVLRIFADVFIKVVKAQLEIIPTFNKGYCNSFGIWAPGKSIRAQDHASIVLSPKLYDKFVLPVEKIISSQFDYITYHTHTGMIWLEEKIADLDNINAIHILVDPEPFGLPLVDILTKIGRIQNKKSIIIEGEFSSRNIKNILKKLSPKGLLIMQRVNHT